VSRNIFLIKEGEFSFLEYSEEVFPGYLFQILVWLLEIDPQNSAFSVSPYDRGTAATLLRPSPDLVMVGCGSCLCHVPLHTDASPEYRNAWQVAWFPLVAEMVVEVACERLLFSASEKPEHKRPLVRSTGIFFAKQADACPHPKCARLPVRPLTADFKIERHQKPRELVVWLRSRSSLEMHAARTGESLNHRMSLRPD
jgi:hypothetical protein